MDDLRLLQGVWAIVAHEAFGVVSEVPDPPDARELGMILDGHSFAQVVRGRPLHTGRFTIDPAASPKHFDLFLTALFQTAPRGGVRAIPGIYRIEGDRLTICLGKPDRPDGFTAPAEKRHGLFVYQRSAEGAT